MSIHIMSAVWKASSYREEKLLVLLALADWANDEGVCWPSLPAIAEKARITKRGASKIMQHFEAEYVIEILEAGGGRGHSARYRIKGEAGRWSVVDLQLGQKGERRSPITLAAKGEPGSSFMPAKGEQRDRQKVNGEARKGEPGDCALRNNRQEPSKKATTNGASAPLVGSDARPLVSAATLLLDNLRLPGSPLLVQAIARAIKFVRDEVNSKEAEGYVDATIDDTREYLEKRARRFLQNNAGTKRQSLLTFFADGLYDDDAVVEGISIDELKMRRESAVGGR